MNYYSAFPKKAVLSPIFHLTCCALVEAVLEQISGTAETKVMDTLHTAKSFNKTWIIWSLVPELAEWYTEVYNILHKLPSTEYMGSQINPNSGNRVHVFITNLYQEWVPNDKLPFSIQ